MRPIGSATELEARRRRAAECFQIGESLRTVADRFGVNPSSVKRWKRAWREGGVGALSAKPHAGGVSKLVKRVLSSHRIPPMMQGLHLRSAAGQTED
jgi:transposase-like protein